MLRVLRFLKTFTLQKQNQLVLVDFFCKWPHMSLHTVVFKLPAPEPPPNVPETMNNVPTTSNNKFPKINHTSPTTSHTSPTSRNHTFPTSNHKAPNTEAARSDYRAPAAVDGASGRFHLLILIRNWSITSAVKRYYVNGIGLKVVFDSCFLPRCRSPSCFALQDISIFIRNHSMSNYCLQ